MVRDQRLFGPLCLWVPSTRVEVLVYEDHDDNDLADEQAEYLAQKRYARRLMAHPDCRDPDHPGCQDCEGEGE